MGQDRQIATSTSGFSTNDVVVPDDVEHEPEKTALAVHDDRARPWPWAIGSAGYVSGATWATTLLVEFGVPDNFVCATIVTAIAFGFVVGGKFVNEIVKRDAECKRK